MKLLHTADLHLDSPLRSLALRDPDLRAVIEAATRAAFSRLIDTALTEGVTALLIAGDLFDGAERSARTAAYLMAEFDRLAQGGIRVFAIKGNHDAENPITGAIDLPDNVHMFDARGGKIELAEGIWIHGVSFPDRHATESLLPRFQPPVPGAINIALMHTSLAGSANHDSYAPCALGDLLAAGFDYWALGHVHRRQVHATDPFVVMPGMPQGRDIGEDGAKSATLLTIDAGRITLAEVPTSVAEFRHSRLDLTGIADDGALRAALRAHLREEAAGLQARAGVLRLTLTGRSPRHWQILRDRDIWSEAAADLARDTGTLWLDKLVIDLAPPADAATAGASVELADLMARIRAEPGFAAAAMDELTEVIGDLPPALRARLLPDERAAAMLAQELAGSGTDRILARLRDAPLTGDGP